VVQTHTGDSFSDIGYATLIRWRTSVLDLQLATDVNLKGLGCCGAAWLGLDCICPCRR